MPPRRIRPNAFEVSFGEEGPSEQTSLRNDSATNSPFARTQYASQSRGHANSSPAPTFVQGSSQRTLVGTQTRDGPSVEKRKDAAREGGSDIGRPEKRPRSSLVPKEYYNPDDDDCEEENADTVILDEDQEEYGSRKPVRILTDFVIFDPTSSNEMVSLDDLTGRHFVAVGYVAPVYLNEEDAGQDDDVLDDAMRQKLRTSPIQTLNMDYISDDDVHIQTQYAWYQLRKPRESYRKIWTSFYRPHKVAQLVMSFASQNPQSCSRAKVMDKFIGSQLGALGRALTRGDIEEAEAMELAILDDDEENESYKALRSSAYIQGLRRATLSPSASDVAPRPLRPRNSLFSTRNIDLRVLQPEYQTSTTVTPLIHKLAEGLFPEQLRVLAGSVPSLRSTRRGEQDRRRKLFELLRKAIQTQGNPYFAREDRIEGKYWSRMVRDSVEYKVGDVVFVPNASFPGRSREPIPPIINEDTVPSEAIIADYFWFARIVYFDQRSHEVHLRWFEHASKTVMQEIHDPYELFISDICDSCPINLIVDKVTVTHHKQSLLRRHAERFAPGAGTRHTRDEDAFYFYSFKYNQSDGSFLSATDDEHDLVPGPPPDCCKICSKANTRNLENSPQSIRGDEGVAYRGVNYHVNDFVMLKGPTKDDLACTIAQIVGFRFDSSARSLGLCMLSVEPLGRINDILHLSTEEDVIIKDEKHLYLTDDPEMFEVNACALIRKCRVVNYFSLPTRVLKAYIDDSPYHFYVKYIFPRLKVMRWAHGAKLNGRSKRPEICIICWTKEDKKKSEDLRDFSKECSRRPLRALDPFGGVGAFGLSMQQAGCLKLTHAIEIAPSAALTLKKNSPDTQVFNQCSNIVLRDAVKTYSVPGWTRPRDHPILPYDHPSLRILPEPIKPGDIDCIVAGFPCQPHSTLNMYQRASDRKSHLILNLLSWVDFTEPKFCFFENVRGFLQYNLNAVQANRYRVKGGIHVGGLKFLVRALVAMGYQVRFAVLQAAHYGLPQTRVRFFLIAARMDQPMPKFPEPLYGFPLKDGLEVKLSHGLSIRPINTEFGIAPFRHITVDDAIGDLYRWDWKNPRARSAVPRTDPLTGKDIPIVRCEKPNKICTPFKSDRFRYHHTKPRTLFQEKAREKQNEIKDLQHITKVLKENAVARVCHIPLTAKADYHALYRDRKDLPDELFEWGWSDPKSAVARKGFRKGLYGRLDANAWFNTTVTNVEPTAKQSWVLNPWCKRMVTVRELARSQGFPDHFKFYCIDGTDVKTMQRGIGNAVPWQVGYALGRELRNALLEEWISNGRPISLDADDAMDTDSDG